MGLVGCSPELVVPDSETGTGAEAETETAEVAIVFSTNMPEQQAVTRSTPLEDYATSFKVFGYKNTSYDAGVYGGRQTVFPCYTVNWETGTAATTTSNSHDWEYVGINGQTIKFWDWSAKAYRFFGATNWGGDLPADPGAYEDDKAYGANGVSGTYEITLTADATDVDDAPYYSHLWFSTGELPTYSDKQFGKPVTLEFLKPFARVRFKFIYVYPREGITLTGKSFKPTDDSDIARKGSITISYPLDGTATKESMLSATRDVSNPEALTAFAEDWDPDDDSKVYTETDEGWYTVLPNITQGNYKLNVNINGSARAATVPAQYMQWLPGYQYTYVFKITEEGGVEIDLVQSAFTQWTDLVTSHEVYNW